MSVFGGDSWAREAQYRKRRVDDLVEEELDGSSYKKLSSGKYACLVCPHNPILDTPLMLSMHSKGSRHRAAESELKERELRRQNEINKRIALSDSSIASMNSNTSKVMVATKPLIEQTRKAASEILSNKTPLKKSRNKNCDVMLSRGHVTNVTSNYIENSSSLQWKQLKRRLHTNNCISGSVERENSSLQLLVGSVIAMGNGTEMKMLSLTLMKKIQMSLLVENLARTLLLIECNCIITNHGVSV